MFLGVGVGVCVGVVVAGTVVVVVVVVDCDAVVGSLFLVLECFARDVLQTTAKVAIFHS